MVLTIVLPSRKNLKALLPIQPNKSGYKSTKKTILEKPEQSGRMVKGVAEFSQYGGTFQPRNAIKSQGKMDFVVERAPHIDDSNSNSDPQENWILHFYGSSFGVQE
jgi:hypothetical protein